MAVLAPDLIATGKSEQSQLNLFIYYVNINPALRNLDLPSRTARVGGSANPPLALNLHYLVSAYGAEPFGPEVLLAWAMKVFHDTPVVPPSTDPKAVSRPPRWAGRPRRLVAQDSSLSQQIEHIRITPETLTTEEIYRLWTAFQAPYRPSIALQVSVVVIQEHRHVHLQPAGRFGRAERASRCSSPVIAALSPADADSRAGS